MLVLSRKIGEAIRIGDDIEIVVLDATRGRVKLGITGPKHVSVRRSELDVLTHTRKPVPFAHSGTVSDPMAVTG